MDIIAEVLFWLYEDKINNIPILLERLKLKKKIQYTFKEM